MAHRQIMKRKKPIIQDAIGILDIIDVGDMVEKRGKMHQVTAIYKCDHKERNAESAYINCAVCVGKISLDDKDPECYGMGKHCTLITKVVKKDFIDEEEIMI